ncbi:microtubule-associated protein futsch-like [Saccostrea echinata]|uniref:microtubule-associated protein futsch-like n=1 Tax=Saccostrea echinata TaxID=191078 RepID=UPI002A7F4E99|nr:microtubule-associated protein futsch-like [Saccostrea echinata]
MEDKELSNTQDKLITRSKAKTSVGHRKIVNYLEKISKDESGAPVKWKFSKKGVKYAQGISKRITKSKTEKKLKRLQSHPLKMENTDSVDENTSENRQFVKKKPGRKKKKLENVQETESKLEKNDEDEDALQTDNLIISIRRLDSESSTPGATERIVTIKHPSENVKTAEKSIQENLLPQPAPIKKRGRPKSIHKMIQEKVKASKLKLTSNKVEVNLRKPSNKSEALRNLEKVVAVKRGRPRKNKLETIENIEIKKEGMGESESREQSVSRVDSDIESIDSNISGSSSRQKTKIRKTYQGIRLGPRKLLRSQDSLMTRRKKVTLSSVAASKFKRKRTLSSDFELLDEVSLKRKIRKEELDDVSRESSIDRDENRQKAQTNDEKFNVPKPQENADNRRIDSSQVVSSEKLISQAKPKMTIDESNDSRENKSSEPEKSVTKVKRRGRPPKKLSEKYQNKNFEPEEMPQPSRKQIFHDSTIPKLSKIKQEHPQKKAENADKNSSPLIEISMEESTEQYTSSRSVFTFGTLKIIGPGGVKLKGNSPLKQVYDTVSEKPHCKMKLYTETCTENAEIGNKEGQSKKHENISSKAIKLQEKSSTITSSYEKEGNEIGRDGKAEKIQKMKIHPEKMEEELGNNVDANKDCSQAQSNEDEISRLSTSTDEILSKEAEETGEHENVDTINLKPEENEEMIDRQGERLFVDKVSQYIESEKEESKNEQNRATPPTLDANLITEENSSREVLEQNLGPPEPQLTKVECEAACTDENATTGTEKVAIEIINDECLNSQQTKENEGIAGARENEINSNTKEEDFESDAYVENFKDAPSPNESTAYSSNSKKTLETEKQSLEETTTRIYEKQQDCTERSDIIDEKDIDIRSTIKPDSSTIFVAEDESKKQSFNGKAIEVESTGDNVCQENMEMNEIIEENIEKSDAALDSTTKLKDETTLITNFDETGSSEIGKTDEEESKEGNFLSEKRIDSAEEMSMDESEESTAFSTENNEMHEEKIASEEKTENEDEIILQEHQNKDNIGKTLTCIDIVVNANAALQNVIREDTDNFSIPNRIEEANSASVGQVPAEESSTATFSKDADQKPDYIPSDSEIPGLYFRNIQKKTTDEEISVNSCMQSEVTDVSDDAKLDISINDQLTEKLEINVDKDENSSSSELSLNHSGNFTTLKDDHLKVTEEGSPEHGDHSSKKKAGKNISPTQRVFQLRQKASRSPLEIIAMRQSKEEREYLLEQSQKAFKREEKQRRLKTKQQKLGNNFEQVHVNTNQKDVSDIFEKVPSPADVVAASVEEQPRSLDTDRQEKSMMLEELCKPCHVILIDFMKYLNVTEKSDMDSEDPIYEKTQEGNESEQQNKEMTIQKEEGKIEEVKETLLSEMQPEAKKKRRPSARKQATGYHFNRKLTAEIVRYPEDERANQSDSVVPPLRLKIKQNLILEPRKKLKPGRPAKRKARKSMSPKKKINFTENRSNLMQEGIKLLSQEVVKGDSPHPHVPSPRHDEESDSDMCECVYNQCGFQSIRKNVETHVHVHLKNTKMTCMRCSKIFKNSSMAYAHSGKEHPNEEVLIEPSEKCDVKQYYKVLKSQSSAPSTSPQQIIPQVEQSPEAVIIKVVLPGNRQGKGCYCCSYCDFSSSLQQDILDHINDNHRPDIQFTCSLCDKQFFGNKDGIADHFKTEHPNEPIMYKSSPDFYDSSKGVVHSHSVSTNDKGNIFEKFSDMFPREKASAESSPRSSKSRWHEKTSAEADSTTVEHDDMHKEPESTAKGSEETLIRITETEPVEDGIEALAKEYGNKNTADETVIENVQTGEKKYRDDTSQEESNDMGLKIVDVVSLRDQADIDWSDTPSSLPQSQSAFGNVPYSQVHNQDHQSLSQSNVSIVSALTSPRQYPNLYSSTIPPRAVPSAIVGVPQRKVPPSSYPLAPKKKNDGKTCTTYKCEKCNVHAPVLATMVEHLRLSHRDIEKLFLCPYCRQYEGATEPDIHRHIKQYHHQNMQQKSPPVALSSAAKQHLRTIQVALGDSHSSTDKVVMEKDIYKCLKCNGHMPSLDFIYSHLEKQHNEFFVNACPECKRFRHKDEQVVFQHIRDVHGKSTENVTLSVAIEENLFTRVQCLTKGKVTPSTKSQSGAASVSLQGPNVSRITTSVPQERGSLSNQISQNPLLRPAIPIISQVRPSFPSPQSMASPLLQQPPQFLSKSSLRKSRPVHRDATRSFTPRSDADFPGSSMPGSGNVNDPPPLMRAPPPLIRFQQTQFGKSINSPQEPLSSQTDPSVRGTSFGMTDRLQRLHSPNSSRISSPVPSAGDSAPIVSRPVLKVPNVRPTLSSPPTTQPPPYSVAIVSRGNAGSVLDLSRQMSSPPARLVHKPNLEAEDVSPDAFQIFNIRPGTPQNDPNLNNYNQFQVRPSSAPNSRMLLGMQSSPRVQALTQQMQTAKGITQQRHYLPRQRFASPNVVVSDKNMPIEGRIFKCPYCPQIIPLSIAEVPRHIEQKHPGCSIVFHRI